MQKNKTHRIISISPTSQKALQLKNQQANKPSTPIKPLPIHTRTNTNAINTNRSTTIKQDSILMETSLRRQNQDIVGRNSVGFRDSKQGQKTKSFKIDQILERIGQNYEGERVDPSVQLVKITHIGYLRELIQQAKSTVHKQENHCLGSSTSKLEELSNKIRNKIFTYFENLHKQLTNQEQKIYEQLQQKIFILQQKSLTKHHQVNTLKNYIEKCEYDINNNYQQIISKIDIKQVQHIVQSYTSRLQFYIDKINLKETLEVGNLDKGLSLDEIVVLRVVGECETKMKEKSEGGSKQLSGKIGMSVSQMGKQSKQKKLFELLNQTQNIPFPKLNGIRKLQENYEPRVSSARGIL